jgi:putative tRNA adenosine deaminase-associated protein
VSDYQVEEMEFDDDGPDMFDGDELDDLDDDDDLIVPDDFDDPDDDDIDDDEDDEDFDYEDALPEEIDFVVAVYREDGAPVAIPMAVALANDLDELIEQLRRLPGDAGACGFVSIGGEFFVIVRVRGRVVNVFLNDSQAALDWPIARDVVDFLHIELPDEDEDSEPVGDLELLADQGLSDFDLETIATDYDEDSDELVRQIVAKLKFSGPFERAITGR